MVHLEAVTDAAHDLRDVVDVPPHERVARAWAIGR